VSFQPRHPHLTALLWTTAFVLLLCAPMFAGRFLIGPDSDQYVAGYAFRAFWTDYVRAHGAMPQWNPYIFGGLPFVAATHGDTFHPIVLLRLVLPTDLAINGSFLVHLVLAGFFTYLFLRGFGLPWIAAVAGGIAYQLTGQVASLVNSGHDGKIIVSSLLPLALWGLTRWMRDGRWAGVGTLALSVGLAVLSPQLQMAYYLLLASGLFALYLAFLDPDRPAPRVASRRLAGALAGVLLGGALAAVQVLPFLQYIPYSPRAGEGESTGWAHATSWAMPPEELLNTLLPQFSGLRDRYSGRNFFKHHSEYLGVGTLILATIGVTQTSRSRLRWAFVGLAAFFLTFALGGATPFFRLWYALLPMVSKARAHSMAFYIVSFAVAVWAALGVERILQREGRIRTLTGWLVALGVLLLLAVTGVLSSAARAFADPAKIENVAANREALTWGAVRVALFGAATLGVVWAWGRGRLRELPFATLLFALVGFDLYSIDRQFFVFSPRAAELFAPDAITQRIAATPKPYRVLDLPQAPTYAGSNLMLYGIPQVLGYHSFQIRYYNDLLGGKNAWRNLFSSLSLWKLIGIRFVIAPDSIQVPGFRRVLGPVPASTGRTAYLYEADVAPPYARVVPGAVKVAAERLVPTLLDPRMDFDRLVLFDQDEGVTPAPLTEMPPPSRSRAMVTSWEPGRMTVSLDPAPGAASYVVVAENWYVDWQATVDGAAAPVLRGDASLITVPVPAGARRVELVYRSARYRTGRLVSILASLLVAGCFVRPALAGRGG
jgi:hypothetical protein